MSQPRNASEVAPAAAAVTCWREMHASCRGAAHEATGAPNQDSAAACRLPSGPRDGLVVAVADGHGHGRHFRSARGAELAVSCACAVACEGVARLSGVSDIEEASRLAREELTPALVARWRAAVETDAAARPFTRAEQRVMLRRRDPLHIAYGSTVLVAIVSGDLVVLAQIGDGDAVVLERGGGASTPVPGDPALDGVQTTSLCQDDAAGRFRVVALDATASRVAGVLLATDGFGNAQAEDQWIPAFSRDLWRLLTDQGADWVGEQLALWTARCASAEGSGDDTTVALALALTEGR